ncbi:putative Sentrin-specific protease 8 [Blattamonas nauphoetae]|uniref:Sentrin-specific protease 8 n=1 Tax=Blattamonas nauphoetae TaxID=2049346 RepID=A0ABQ9XM53_9EUKA|nr:putative Sentrin-specific protease 8 [Blattamonas nauphoetae]
MSDETGIVLTYEYTTIYQDACDSLTNRSCLTDPILEFSIQFAIDQLPDALKQQVSFIWPSLLFLLDGSVDEETSNSQLDSNNLKSFRLILFPMCLPEENDQTSGDHWSLLLFCKDQFIFDSTVPFAPAKSPSFPCFCHLDSVGRSHAAIASRVSKRLSAYFSGKDDSYPLYSLEVPQQTNGYDCGVYTIAFSEAILDAFRNRTNPTKATFSKITPTSITQKRTQILDLINSLSEAQKHTQSK